MIAWRITKTRHAPFDGTGALLWGARWNSPGRAVIYAADSFAGAILEILAHSARPRTLPGPHHAVRIDIPDDLAEMLDPGDLNGWENRDSRPAVEFGDAWLRDARSPAMVVPALPSRPIGRNVLINPGHPAAARISVSAPFPVPWDERLF
ncbi:MAG TPA: RES domain-containing protein [Longimicrobium sp.]|nr:RES domain-containing protein [Longimicrobium sp.]